MFLLKAGRKELVYQASKQYDLSPFTIHRTLIKKRQRAYSFFCYKMMYSCSLESASNVVSPDHTTKAALVQ